MLETFNALIACLITTITLYVAGTIIFGKSKNTTLKNILAILVCTTLITIIFINMNEILKTILMCTIFTMVFKIIFKSNISKSVLMSIIYIIILMLSDLLVLLFLIVILQMPNPKFSTLLFVVNLCRKTQMTSRRLFSLSVSVLKSSKWSRTES